MLVKNNKILLVEDDVIDANFLAHLLTSSGYSVTVAEAVEAAMTEMQYTSFALVVADLKMVEMDGIQLLELIKRYYPDTSVIICTAYASVDTAVEAMRKGAKSYFVKGSSTKKLLDDIEDIIQTTTASENVDTKSSDVDDCVLLYRSSIFQAILNQASKIVSSSNSLMVTGNRGSGRAELIKKIYFSKRINNLPLFELDAGNIVSIEDSVNALHSTPGSLLIKNIDKLSPEYAEKLFSSIYKIISPQCLDNTAKTIYLTAERHNITYLKNLLGEKYYFQYCASQIDIPSLNERGEDIPVILDGLLSALNIELNTSIKGFEPEVVDFIINVSFQDEFQGLKCLVRELFIKRKTGLIRFSDIPKSALDSMLYADDKSAESVSLSDIRERAERDFILQTLQRTKMNKTKASFELGISTRQLYSLIKKYNIR